MKFNRIDKSFPVVRIIVALVICALIVTPAFSQSDPTDEQAVLGLANRLGIVIVAALVALVSRAVLLRRLNKLMLSESKKASEFPAQETLTPEVEARQELIVLKRNVKSVFQEAGSGREKLLAGARKAINRQFFVQLAIITIYANTTSSTFSTSTSLTWVTWQSNQIWSPFAGQSSTSRLTRSS